MQSGFILSQEDMCEKYGEDNQHYTLYITDLPPDYDVAVDFIYMVLEYSMHCVTEDITHDAFRVYKNNETDPIFKSGDFAGFKLPALLINTTSAYNLTLKFTSGKLISFSKFVAKYHCK